MVPPLVLIIEDNEANLMLERDLLELHGFRTVEARTAADGIALAAERLPDVVLMDIHLGGAWDGVAALSRLRGDARTAGIPVLALTAYATDGDRERFQDAGFDGYLPRPIDIKAFPATVRSFCRAAANEGRAKGA